MGAYENDLGSPKVITPTVESVFTNFQEKTYIIGESIDIKLKLSENVNVTGTPRLKLETGDVDSYANYISGSGNDTLLFRYIVSSGDTTSSLDYTGNDALELNGGIMTFITGTSLNRALPDPGSANSLKGTFGSIYEY